MRYAYIIVIGGAALSVLPSFEARSTDDAELESKVEIVGTESADIDARKLTKLPQGTDRILRISVYCSDEMSPEQVDADTVRSTKADGSIDIPLDLLGVPSPEQIPPVPLDRFFNTGRDGELNKRDGDLSKIVYLITARLNHLGYAKPALTEPYGRLGLRTRVAIARYQTAHGLRIDGRASGELLNHILGRQMTPARIAKLLARPQEGVTLDLGLITGQADKNTNCMNPVRTYEYIDVPDLSECQRRKMAGEAGISPLMFHAIACRATTTYEVQPDRKPLFSSPSESKPTTK